MQVRVDGDAMGCNGMQWDAMGCDGVCGLCSYMHTSCTIMRNICIHVTIM